MLECLIGFRCVTGCHSLHRIFGSTFLPTSGSRQASSSGNTATLSSLARHTNSVAYLSCPLRVNLNAVVVQQRRGATRFLCKCRYTGILTPQWPPCTCDLQSTVIACVSVVCCVRDSTRTQFLHASAITDHRIHSFEAHPSQRSTAAAALQASLAARLHGKLCETSFRTHLLDLCLSFCADGARAKPHLLALVTGFFVAHTVFTAVCSLVRGS